MQNSQESKGIGIEVEQRGEGVHVVRLLGELRGNDGPAIQEELHSMIGEPGSATVVDLSGMGWVDSAGLGHLISLATHARLSKSRLLLVGPTPFVAGVLEVTNLDDWFEIVDTVEAADKALAAS